MSSILSRIGYPCINITLKSKYGIYTNRQMTKKSFLAQKDNLKRCSSLALSNVKDLVKIVQWNERNGIKFFRLSSNMFPWMSEYQLCDLPDWKSIKANLKLTGKLVKEYGQRLEFHPGPFNVLASLDNFVVEKTIKDLNQHAEILDEMDLEPSHWNPINIHLNTTQGGKQEAAKRFCENFKRLKPSAQARLVIENDDKPNQYSVKDLYDLVYSKIKIPITFDSHHHKFCSGNMDHDSAAKLAASTWNGIAPSFHFASTINHESINQMARAHADWIYDEITDWNTGAWIMCECKSKELAVLKYINEGVKPSEYKEIYQCIN